MSRTYSSETGFTIIELMVALFIFAMISAAGVGLLSFGVRAQATAATRLDIVAAEQRLSNLLAADLAETLPRTTRDIDGEPVRAFTGNDGTSDRVMGYVRGGWTNPDREPRPSIQRVDVMLVDGRLERRTYPMADGAQPGPSMVLANHVESVAMRYRDKTGDWRSLWDNGEATSLPIAAEMTLKRKGQAPLRLAWLVGARYQ